MNKFKIEIESTQEEVKFSASGNLTFGMVRGIIGTMEQIKARLLIDLEKNLDEGYHK